MYPQYPSRNFQRVTSIYYLYTRGCAAGTYILSYNRLQALQQQKSIYFFIVPCAT